MKAEAIAERIRERVEKPSPYALISEFRCGYQQARRALELVCTQQFTDGVRSTTGEGWKLWCLEAEMERDALMRGEFICRECGLRKNSGHHLEGEL